MMNFMLAYQRVCPCMIQLYTLVENVAAFCNKAKTSPYVKVVETKGHFAAKAMLRKNGAQQPHSLTPNFFFGNIQTRGHNVSPD